MLSFTPVSKKIYASMPCPPDKSKVLWNSTMAKCGQLDPDIKYRIRTCHITLKNSSERK